VSRALIALLLVCSSVAGAQPPTGAGDKRRIIGVLEVKVEGVPKEIAAQFQTDLEKQLDSNAYWLAPKARLHELMTNSTKWTEGCVVGPCLHEVKTQTGADIVLLAALTGAGTSFGYIVTLVRTDTGTVFAQEADRCDVCTVSEALTAATLAAVRLVTAVPDKLPDEAAERAATMDAMKTKLASEASGDRRHSKKLGIILTIAGLVVAGVGTAIYVVRDHADYGLATAAVGGGLAVGGVVTLTF
jgi:hypothetical protein